MDTMPPDWDRRSAELARASIDAGDPIGWFDQLYSEGIEGTIELPWDRPVPLPLLTDFIGRCTLATDAKVLVVGCGLGIDSEYLGQIVEKSASVTAFDISSTAINIAILRYPSSRVNYQVANLFNPPQEWSRTFDLVVEVINLQALPRSVRSKATTAITDFVAPGGTLIVIENVHDESGADSMHPPWPFTLSEMEEFTENGLELLELTSGQSMTTGASANLHRWRGVFQRKATQ